MLFLLSGITAVAHDGSHKGANAYVPADSPVVVGEGKFRYEIVSGWGKSNEPEYKVRNGKGLVIDKAGHIYLLHGDAKQSIFLLNSEGKVLSAGCDFLSSPHGINIATEGDREVLYLCDNSPNGKVVKTTLNGTILNTIRCPEESGLYPDPKRFKPAEVIPLEDGGILVLDGYGSDFILRFDKHGKYVTAFGGTIGKGEAQLKRWGPHGGHLSPSKSNEVHLALSDQQKIKRFTLGGKHLETIMIPGGNPRDLLYHRGHYFVPHFGDKWPADRNSPGFISVLNKNFKVIANIGGAPAVYKEGALQQMHHNSHHFCHPHTIIADQQGSLYLTQDSSNDTWPIKLRPIE